MSNEAVTETETEPEVRPEVHPETRPDSRPEILTIGVFGLGYVGAVTVAGLAKLGHRVIGVDIAPRKVDDLNRGKAPVVEPGLDEILAEYTRRGMITATVDPTEVASAVDVVMIAVGTPSTASGGVDDRHLLAAAAEIGEGLRANPRPFVPVISRSTSLPEVHYRVRTRLELTSRRVLGPDLGYACHPEFLREASALADFFDPPAIVVGSDEPRMFDFTRRLYPGIDAPMIEVGVGEAAMVKYAANCYHAAKVTFANEIGRLCAELDINSIEVMDIFCRDDKLNISTKYLRPGSPFGGSCLPKDLRAVIDMARQRAVPLPMLAGILLSNRDQVDLICDRILGELPDRVAVVGMAFKEGTDDLREAPMVAVVERLKGKGVDVAVYDDELAVDRLHGANRTFALSALPHLVDLVHDDLGAVLAGADVVVISHSLDDQTWSSVELENDAVILDLCNVTRLASHPGYHGLYWPGDRQAVPVG